MVNVRLIVLKYIYDQDVKDSRSLSKLSDQSLRQVYWLVRKLKRGLSLNRNPESHQNLVSPNIRDISRVGELLESGEYRSWLMKDMFRNNDYRPLTI